MRNYYWIRDEYDDATDLQRLTIWSGSFADQYEGEARELPTHDGYTVQLATRTLTVTCESPRTDANYLAVDEAINEAINEAISQSIWDLLDEPAPDGCEAVQELYSWALNYGPGTNPFVLFLDLIGYSEDEFGQQLQTGDKSRLGYIELDKLGRALAEYSDNPQTVREYVARLIEAESNE